MSAIAGRGSSSQKLLSANVFRHFTPGWFAVTMGTGSISILFHNFPYGTDSPIMKLFSLMFFFLDLTLFLLFTALSVARYTLFPGIWNRMLQHPVQCLYLGTIPMGATTLLTASITVIYGTYGFGGRPFVYAIWVFWWFDVAVSILCCWGIMHIMITRHEHSFESLTPAWLLPVVTLIVGSSTGGTIAQALISFWPNAALLTIVFSACMVTIGLTISTMLLTVYLVRTIMHGYLEGPDVLSIFLPLGATGQSSYSILLIGSGLRSTLPLTQGKTNGVLGTPSTGETTYVICVVIAFALWSIGTMWTISALLGLLHSLRRAQVPFRLTFWSIIFPNGVYANCTLALAGTFSSAFFRVWGAIYAVVTLLLWIYVAAQTLHLCLNGRVFEPLPMEEGIGNGDSLDREKTSRTRFG